MTVFMLAAKEGRLSTLFGMTTLRLRGLGHSGPTPGPRQVLGHPDSPPLHSLLRASRLHLLAFYGMFRLSAFGREVLQNHGSGYAMDMLYRNEPQGRTPLGRWLDRYLLTRPVSRATRQRLPLTKRCLSEFLDTLHIPGPARILNLGCGVARDTLEVLAAVPRPVATALCCDIDLDSLRRAGELACRLGVRDGTVRFSQIDVLAMHVGRVRYHAVIANGLSEYLDDGTMVDLLTTARSALVQGGILITDVTSHHSRSSEWLMEKVAGWKVHYRTGQSLASLLHQAGFTGVRLIPETLGILTMAVAYRPQHQ